VPLEKRHPIGTLLNPDVDSCFVAMDFSPKYAHIYDELLQPVVQDHGLICIRSDEIISEATNVVDEIVHIMQVARAVIVDLTGLNPNVLIELGIAQALRRPLIIINQDSGVPFDVQPRRIIRYDLSVIGRKRLKEDIAQALKASIYPREVNLREMLIQGSASSNIVVYGRVSDDHVKGVFPPVDAGYAERLAIRSGEASGIWDLALAFQKVAFGRGEDPPRVVAADGTRAPLEILTGGNVFVFGGPGSNPFFARVAAMLDGLYVNSPGIVAFPMEGGKKRYRIVQEGQVVPPDQDDLLASHVDVGLVIRCPNPSCEGASVWLAAGIRSYGTEAAVKLLVTPSLIRQVRERVPIESQQTGFWSILKVSYDPDSQEIGEISVFAAGSMRLRVTP
jgi:hypothetical protein